MYCTEYCSSVYIFGGIILPLLIALLVIVVLKYKNNASDKKEFMGSLLFYLLLTLILYFLLNWLCENRYMTTANIIAFLPIILYAYTGYMFVNSTDCMNGIKTIYNSCLKYN